MMIAARLIAATAAVSLLSAPALASHKGEFDYDRLTVTFNSPFGAVPRDALSAAQKRELRAYGREMCRKRLKYEVQGYIRNIAILSDGRVRCHYAS